MATRLTCCTAAVAALLASAGAVAQEPPAAVAPRGDPAAGRELFVGAVPLSLGGPPCDACHGITGEGLGVSASYGPDLSKAVSTYGADALVGMLEDPPFPSMAPVYAGRAPTVAERAHLVAFLSAAGGQAPHESSWFVVHAGVLFAAAVLATALVGRARAVSARDRLKPRTGSTEVRR